MVDGGFAVADAAVNFAEVLLPGISGEPVVHLEPVSSDHQSVGMTNSGVGSSRRVVGIAAEALIDERETLYNIAVELLDEELRCPFAATIYFPLALWFASETDYAVGM